MIARGQGAECSPERAAYKREVALLTARLKSELAGVPFEPVRQGRYTFVRRLGSGAMGTVYEAQDERLDRRVAIKYLHPHFVACPRARARFLREARAMARLSHPHTVQVFDVSVSDDEPTIVMEYLAGGTLREWLGLSRTRLEICAVFVAIGNGLVAAHERGIVHRDFKPLNVLIDDRGRPKVGDFGLAGLGRLDGSRPIDLTPEGAFLGTPRYMAPEQLVGDPPDARSDQYAYCLCLLEALGGQKCPVSLPVFPEDLPLALCTALERGLSTLPADRWPTMEALLAALSAAIRELDPMLDDEDGEHAVDAFPHWKYEKLELLGRGGSGVVYRARHRRLDKVVAIKLLHQHVSATNKARFAQEARVAAGLHHDNIVGVADAGEAGGGTRYLEMEYVEGSDLSTFVAHRAPLPWRSVREIGLQLCAALGAAHNAGIIHRDIKPQNIRIRPDGRIKVLDFGIARLLEKDIHLTCEGVAVGTPAYMAPEQLHRGQSDHRVDIYGVAVVLYELLTGVRPHPQTTNVAIVDAKARRMLSPPSARVSGVPAGIDRILLRALSTEPERRFDDMNALAAALSGVHDNRPRRWGGRRVLMVAAAISGLVGLVALQMARGPVDVRTERMARPLVPCSSGWDRQMAPALPRPAIGPPAISFAPAAAIEPALPPVAPPLQYRRRTRPRPPAEAWPILPPLTGAQLAAEAQRADTQACQIYGFPGDEVVVELTIQPDGRLREVRAMGEHGHTRLGRCVVAAVRHLAFPASAQTTDAYRHAYRFY